MKLSQQEIRKTSWLENFWAKSSHIILLENLFRQNQAKYFDLNVFSKKSSQIFWLLKFSTKSIKFQTMTLKKPCQTRRPFVYNL